MTETLDSFSKNLVKLNCIEVSYIYIKNLPKSLKNLSLRNSEVKKIFLEEGLENITLENVRLAEKNFTFPKSTKSLNLHYIKDVESITIPEGNLNRLCINSLLNLKNIFIKKTKLEQVIITNCPLLSSSFTYSLEEVRYCKFQNICLRNILNYFFCFKELYLDSCDASPDCIVNGNIEKLSLVSEPRIKVIDISILPRLKELDLSFTDITYIDLSFSEIRKLKLEKCYNLENISPFPKTLESLSLRSCINLEKIYNIPKNMLFIDISHTLINLENFREFPSKIRVIDVSNTPIKRLPCITSDLRELDLSYTTIKNVKTIGLRKIHDLILKDSMLIELPLFEVSGQFFCPGNKSLKYTKLKLSSFYESITITRDDISRRLCLYKIFKSMSMKKLTKIIKAKVIQRSLENWLYNPLRRNFINFKIYRKKFERVKDRRVLEGLYLEDSIEDTI